MEHAEALRARLRLGGHYSDLHNMSIVLLEQAMHRVHEGTMIQEEVEKKKEDDLLVGFSRRIINASYEELTELNSEGLTPYETCILVHDVIARWLVPISSPSLLRCIVSIIKRFCRSATQTCHDLARRGAYTEAAFMLHSGGADPFWIPPFLGGRLPLWQLLCSQSSERLHEAMEAAIMRSVRSVPKIVCDWVEGYNNDQIVFPPENIHAVVYALETIPWGIISMSAHGAAAVLQREIEALRMETLPFINANEQRRECALELCAKAESYLNKLLAPRAVAFAAGMHPRLGAEGGIRALGNDLVHMILRTRD